MIIMRALAWAAVAVGGAAALAWVVICLAVVGTALVEVAGVLLVVSGLCALGGSRRYGR